MKPKKTISAYVLMVGMLALMMAGSLVVYQIYVALVKSQISDVQKIAIKPLDGIIKGEVIDNLKRRRVFDQIELNQVLTQFSLEVAEEGVLKEMDLSLNQEASKEATIAGKVEEGNGE